MKDLGVIICKRDATEGTIYCTETCDYLVLEDEGKFAVEGFVDGLKKPINFTAEDEESFVVGYYDSEEEALRGVSDFEKSQWG